MKLSGVELVRVEIPFRLEIGTAAGVHRTRSLLFVRRRRRPEGCGG
jgi:hypothetical protein